MDIGTHALASFALMRAAFPRAPWAVWPVVIFAGIASNADKFSATYGPAAYLSWHLTYTHSFVTALLLAMFYALLYRVLAPESFRSRFSPAAVFVLTLVAGCLHLVMDAFQSDGVLLFWPFSPRRFAGDWLASFDPLIIFVLIVAILLPELLRLVSSEIGAKDKKPRGQTAAIIALSLIAVYIGGRATFHSNARSALESLTYHSELPRRAAAYPVATSLFTWNGIVETESALHKLTVNLASGAAVNPDAGVTLHKPEASPLLDSARNTPSAQAFLRVACFPKATIEKTVTGFRVELRDLRYSVAGESGREILALVGLSPSGKIISHELVWARDWKNR